MPPIQHINAVVKAPAVMDEQSEKSCEECALDARSDRSARSNRLTEGSSDSIEHGWVKSQAEDDRTAPLGLGESL